MHPTDTAPTDHRALDDRQLVDRVLARDQAAWRELLRRFRPLLCSCIGKVAARNGAWLPREDVNEIYGDVLVSVLRDDMHKLRVWDPARGSKLSSWLALLAMNTACDYLRTTARRPHVVDLPEDRPERPSGGPTALDELLEKERRSRLHALLVDFSARDRRFVELYYGLELEPEQVAAAMRISVKTVYSKKHKLRHKLEALAARVRDPEPTRRAA